MFFIVNFYRFGEFCEYLRVWFVCKFWFVVIWFVVKLLLCYVVCKYWLEFRFVFGLEECVCLRKGE